MTTMTPKKGKVDFSQCKVYKLTCPEGYYYFGHTCTSLRKRKYVHTQGVNTGRKAYEHFGSVGWDLVKIELVEEVPTAESFIGCRRAEQKHIDTGNGDDKCLNMKRAYRTKEQKTEDAKRWKDDNKALVNERQRQHRAKSPERYAEYDVKRSEDRREYRRHYNKKYREERVELIGQKKREYKQEHKDAFRKGGRLNPL